MQFGCKFKIYQINIFVWNMLSFFTFQFCWEFVSSFISVVQSRKLRNIFAQFWIRIKLNKSIQFWINFKFIVANNVQSLTFLETFRIVNPHCIDTVQLFLGDAKILFLILSDGKRQTSTLLIQRVNIFSCFTFIITFFILTFDNIFVQSKKIFIDC